MDTVRTVGAPLCAGPTRSVITLAHEPIRHDPGRAPAQSPPDGEGSAAASGFDLIDAYDAHGGQLFGFALNALRDRGAAEDCVQETFLRAWRSRERFDPHRGGVRTWLFAIARNVIADALRSRQRLPRTADDEHLLDRPEHDTDPVERLRLQEALATLSREHRQVVVAVHLVGMAYGELSAAVDVPVATLRTRAYYGLRALRRHLEDRED